MALLSCLILTGITTVALSVPAAPTRVTNAPTHVAPTPTMAACATEDGAGQALCYWNAQEQGNGYGESVVSGDCAPDVMGNEASALCVRLYAQGSSEVVNADGSINSIPNGADLARECIEENGEQQLSECFMAWL